MREKRAASTAFVSVKVSGPVPKAPLVSTVQPESDCSKSVVARTL